MKVMITGHTPARVGDNTEKILNWIKKWLRELKPTAAITGMSKGVDILFWGVAHLWEVPIYCYLTTGKVELHIAAGSDRIYVVHDVDARDRAMVDAADCVLAVWDGFQQGGTWETIKYAREQGKNIIYLMIGE